MNRLKGTITAVQNSGGISLIDLDVRGHRLSSLVIETPQSNPHLHPGNEVLVLFKETEVSIATSFSGGISCRNRLRSVIRAIERSEILSKLTLDFDGIPVVSVITTRSAEALGLKVGDTVEGIVKSNEITIKKADTEVHA
jgi:molybdate transport system regulatory protein